MLVSFGLYSVLKFESWHLIHNFSDLRCLESLFRIHMKSFTFYPYLSEICLCEKSIKVLYDLIITKPSYVCVAN